MNLIKFTLLFVVLRTDFCILRNIYIYCFGMNIYVE